MIEKDTAKRTARLSPKTSSTRRRASSSPPGQSGGTVLLSGGNPQIAKGYGNAPVQEYIAAMPGWKSDIGKRLDALIVEAVPNVEKAVKWNSPLYGTEKGSWFLGFHCLTKYVKVAFFRGAQLRPEPPGASSQRDVRYLDVHEDADFDHEQFIDWVKQASKLPGERM